MTDNAITNSINTIYSLLHSGHLLKAIDKLSQLSEQFDVYDAIPRIEVQKTTYNYMLHYLGNEDPQRPQIYLEIIQQLYALADYVKCYALKGESSNIYFEKLRFRYSQTTLSYAEFLDVFISISDNHSLNVLLEEGDDKRQRMHENQKRYEQTVLELFDAIFVSQSFSEEQATGVKAILQHSSVSKDAKCMVASAMMMALLFYFDAEKVMLLSDLAMSEDIDIAVRGIIGLIVVTQLYFERLNDYSAITSRLLLMSDDVRYARRLMMVINGFVDSLETEAITKRLREDIIPAISKMGPLKGNKIDIDDWMNPEDVMGMNPEWDDKKKNDVSEKLMEFSELQQSGADVYHSTFSEMKFAPFFHTMGNWFLPFDANHTMLNDLGQSSIKSMLETMANGSGMNNSDRYSLFFTLSKMASGMVDAIRDQIQGQVEQEDLDNLTSAAKKQGLSEGHRIKMHCQDLYRFFKLFRRKHDFIDIFDLRHSFKDIDAFKPVVLLSDNLLQLATKYFSINHYAEAENYLSALVEINNNDVPSEVWQKLGYINQLNLKYEEATACYERALMVDENNTWLLKRLAHCYRIIEKPEKSQQYYMKLGELKPSDISIQLAIGHCYFDMEEYEDALNYYFKVDIEVENNIKAWRSIAWTSYLLNKYDVARRYYDRILADSPNEHDYLNAAHVELTLKSYTKAFEYYARCYNMLNNAHEKFEQLLQNDAKTVLESGVEPNLYRLICDKIVFGEQDNA